MIKKCQIKNCKEKAIAFIKGKKVCKKHYQSIKYPPKTLPVWAKGLQDK